MKNIKKNNRVYNNRYIQKNNDSNEKLSKSFYFKKMIKGNNFVNSKNDLNISAQNFDKAFTNVENILDNDIKKKKAIKYVIQIGKTKQIKPIMNKNIYQLINYQQQNYRTIENEEKLKENLEERALEMDMDLSLSNEEENNNMNYIDRDRLITEANNRISKSLQKRKLKVVDNEKEELINMIEELEEMNKNLRKNNIKKNSEINLLKNELNNVQKELDEKLAEHDKEIEQIYNNNNSNNDKENEINNKKLKVEYFQ